jgi:hypothetical protein
MDEHWKPYHDDDEGNSNSDGEKLPEAKMPSQFERFFDSKRLIRFSELSKLLQQVKEAIIAKKGFIDDGREVRELFLKSSELMDVFTEFTAIVAQGEKSIIALSREQVADLGAVYDMGALELKIWYHGPIFALCKKEGGDPVEVELKYATGIRLNGEDDLAISQGLARQLGVTTGEKVIVMDIYQKIENMNLDDL